MPAPTSTPALPEPIMLPVESLAELDLALYEIGRLTAIEAQLNAELKAQTAKAKKELAAKLFLQVGGQAVAFVDRIEALEASILGFFVDHRQEILPPGRKSRELNHGRIGEREAPARLVPREGLRSDGKPFDEDGDPEFIRKFLVAALKFLGRLTGFLLKARPFFRVHATINRQALLEAVEAKTITRAELRRFGYKFVPAQDRFFCVPADDAVESLESPPPQPEAPHVECR